MTWPYGLAHTSLGIRSGRAALNAEFVTELEVPAQRTVATRIVSALGPLTAFGGVVWAILQPYRITLLHPRGESFWWLMVEPPLLVIVVGLLFHFFVVPGLLEDLEEERAASS